MAKYSPSAPFNVPIMLLLPTYTNVNGVRTKTFPAIADGILCFCSFRSFGGTERDVNGVFSVEDTATVEMWYRDDVTSGCRIAIAGTTKVYDVLGEPENIELRNQFLRFKVTRVKGGA